MGEKQKKSIFKRWWFWVIIVIVIIAIASQGGDGDTSEEVVGNEIPNQIEDNIEPEDAEPEPEVESEEEEGEGEAEEIEEPSEKAGGISEESTENDIPREYKNALRAAQNYVDIMPFSERGLFEQLTSEYGDQYSEEAARYAIEKVEVDYNEEALEAAKNYQKVMPMSDKELFDQLTSEHGEQFTEEQAQYAIDNLPE